MQSESDELTSRRRLPELIELVPFRVRLLLVSTLVVVLTAALLSVGLYLNSRSQVINGYRERLSAIARGASIVLGADTVSDIVEGQVSIPQIVALRTLRELWSGDADSVVGSDRGGLALVRRSGSEFHVIAHSSWPVGQPWEATSWTPPPWLPDSLANIVAGRAHLYWYPADDRLMAIAPVQDASSIPVGLVVAYVDRSAALVVTRRQLLALAWLPGLALALSILLASMLSRQLVRRVGRLAEAAEVLARGDLRADLEMKTADELGTLAGALRDMAGHLRSVLGEVQSGTGEVGATAEVLASGSEQMHAASSDVASAARTIAHAAGQQTAGIEAIAAMAANAASQAESVASSARLAHEMTVSVVVAAERVAGEAAEALARMGAISTLTRDALPAVNDLGVKSQRINEVAGRIALIADQSNLLALNAAIEAARAGEHGRGFGVVAQEVRKLSVETASALKAIQSAADEIEHVSQRTGQHIDEMFSSVQAGEAAIRVSVDSVDAILVAIARGREATGHIATEAASQLTSSAAVSEHIREVARAAAENAAAASQVSVSAEEQMAIAGEVAESSQRLATVAVQLRDTVGRFQL